MANWAAFPTALQAELQTGFLEREFEEGLDSILGYRREALPETVPARLGEAITRTRTSRKNPVTAPLNPGSTSSLDNGLTATDAALEQYTLTTFEYGDATDVNLMADLASIADNMTRVARNNGVQAAQSLERIARSSIFGAYLGGNTRVRVDLGSSTTTTCHVDDIRGFTTVLVNGVPTPISGAHTLSVAEISTSGSGVTQTLVVSAAVADGTNYSTAPDGISGVLTFATATAPVHGDAIVASNAARVLRPFGRATTAKLQGGDVLTLGILQDATTILKNNAVPPCADGSYHVILDNTSMRQLFADQDFKILYAGRYQSAEYQTGDIIRLLDMTFIPTTEAYVQLASTNTANGATDAVNVTVRRPLVIGAEAMIEGDFEGLDSWLTREGMNNISDVFMIDSVAHIIRPPLDRLAQWASFAWVWIGGYAIPTDLTATTSIIPTASSALYKRAVILETAS